MDLPTAGLIVAIVTGTVSFIAWVVKWIRNAWRYPRLKIDFDKSRDLVVYETYYDSFNKVWTRKFLSLQVKNEGRDIAQKCEAIVTALEYPKTLTTLIGKSAVHWADTPYSGQTTGSYPIDIISSIQRLDVVFTDKELPVGSWFAVPFALLKPQLAKQFYLPEGEYIIDISVSCVNGRGDHKKFKIISPKNWIDLDIIEV
jgi:hypothetical protein